MCICYIQRNVLDLCVLLISFMMIGHVTPIYFLIIFIRVDDPGLCENLCACVLGGANDIVLINRL